MLVTGDWAVASVAGLAFGVGILNGACNNIARRMAKLGKTAIEVPLTADKAVRARRKLRMLLFRDTMIILTLVGGCSIGPQIRPFPVVTNRALTLITGLCAGSIGLFIGYRNLRWTMQIKVVRPTLDEPQPPIRNRGNQDAR